MPPPITMDELPERLEGGGRSVVLDVRSRLEFVTGHVPSAVNAPVRAIARAPHEAARTLGESDVIYVHCTKGVRAARAVEALRDAGLDNVILVRDSGMPEWAARGLPVERGLGRSLTRRAGPRSWGRALVVGAGVGIVIGMGALIASRATVAGLSRLLRGARGGSERGRRASHALPAWVSGTVGASALAALLVLERRRPLRAQTQPKLRRDARNLAMAAVGGAGLLLAQTPVIGPLTQLVERRRWGLLKVVRLPPAVETLLAVVLMDYTLYVWHWLTHRNAFLWRFHEAHHVDLDLSATTATRFHFGELLLSVPWRAAQVTAIGVSPRAFSIWQTLTTAQIFFHHANLRLPPTFERWLARLIVTPRMHGIHHSVVRRETDSNWSTIFSVFDRLHGTLRLNVPQSEITIGVPAYRDESEVTLGKSLALPFRRGLFTWSRPSEPDPERPSPESAVTTLAT